MAMLWAAPWEGRLPHLVLSLSVRRLKSSTLIKVANHCREDVLR